MRPRGRPERPPGGPELPPGGPDDGAIRACRPRRRGAPPRGAVRTLIGVSAVPAHRLPADEGPLAEAVEQADGRTVVYLTRAGLPVARVEPVDPVVEAERHMRENLGQIFGLAVRQRVASPEPDERLAELLDGERHATADEYARFLRYLGIPDDLARVEAAEAAAWVDDLVARYLGSRDR